MKALAHLSRRKGPSTTKRDDEPRKYKHFEEVLELINPFGPYQIFVCICIIVAQIEWAGNFSFINVVGSVEPTWDCELMTGDHVEVHPPTYLHPEKCAQLKSCRSFKAVKNRSEIEFFSIVASFRLICDDDNKPEMIQTIQAIALMIGSIAGGHLGDHFGRQFLFYMSQLGIVITSCMTTSAMSWTGYAFFQFLNGLLYGIIEVESLTLVMEYTSNRYRMIPVACFQWNIANMVIALIAYLTWDWQNFFVILNLITSPIIMALMLFHESPRWLIAKGEFSEACNVLNDIADKRWNGAEATFAPNDLKGLRHESKKHFYSFYDLFSRERFRKQSLMQMMSVFTYSMVAMAYFYVIREFTGSSIMIVFLDGFLRLFIPVLIIVLDLQFTKFTRRFQFLLSLSLMGTCFALVIVMMIAGLTYQHHIVIGLVTIGGLINDSVFWMNIVQVTTQRYPTVIRCIAFGCLHSVRHIGTIIGVLAMQPLLHSAFPIGAFLIPLVLILATLAVGWWLQPDTKGKALLDTLEELDYTRVENALPRALYKMAMMHRVMQTAIHGKIVNENKDRWEEWRKELDKREQLPPKPQRGRVNQAFEEIGLGSRGGPHLSTEDNAEVAVIAKKY